MSGPVLVQRSEVLGCANPKLTLDVVFGGVLVDPISVEFAVFDMDTGSPVQTFPVTPGTSQALTLTDCPTGQRLATGQYAANWTVDAAEPQTLHRITWRWQRSATDPVETLDFDFNVAAVVATAVESPEVCAFRARFPDASDPLEVPGELIELALEEATLFVSDAVYGAKAELARRYYAAHLLFAATGGARAKGATLVAAGSASVAYDAARQDFSTTIYGQQFRFIARSVTGGGVVC